MPRRECFLDLLTEEGGREFVVEECGERQVRLWVVPVSSFSIF